MGVLPEAAMTMAAKTALPQPPNTNQKVPRNSAKSRLLNDIVIPQEVDSNGRETVSHGRFIELH
jgi:hypothetical protein